VSEEKKQEMKKAKIRGVDKKGGKQQQQQQQHHHKGPQRARRKRGELPCTLTS
jgi:hypothetical protein